MPDFSYPQVPEEMLGGGGVPPGGPAPEAGNPETGVENPVIGALQTIGLFAQSQAEKGNSSIMQAFQGLVQAMGQQSPMQQPEQPVEPMGAAPVEQSAQGRPGEKPIPVL